MPKGQLSGTYAIRSTVHELARRDRDCARDGADDEWMLESRCTIKHFSRRTNKRVIRALLADSMVLLNGLAVIRTVAVLCGRR
jgi:hypothetical protein